MEPINVHFVLLPSSLILDWSGPAEALRIANKTLQARGLPERFRLHFNSPQREIASSVGAQLTQLEPLPELRPTCGAWVVLAGVTGSSIATQGEPVQAVLRWLRGLRLGGGIELITICAGSVLAAHAGLLSHRRATTHHLHLDELRRVDPTCDVVENRVFVEDGAIFSSAGVTAGIDLMLHRICATLGAPLAAQVAQAMVVALRRGPHDPELSPFLRYRNHLHPALHRLQDAIAEDPRSDWSAHAMAAHAACSVRHLSRLFLEHAGIGPSEYLRSIRLEIARIALASGQNVSRAAEQAGFHSDAQLRRAWRAHGFTGSPSAHRAS